MIWQMIEDWFRGILTDGILSNLSGLFDSVNTEVGEIATQVGTTPAGWNAGIFNMIRSLSENVIVPIAGVIITFVMCYELIQLVIEKNNLHDLDTSLAESEKKLMTLVCAKLLCAVAAPYEYEAVTAVFTCGGYTFTAKGRTTLCEGWREIERLSRAASGEQDEDAEPEAVLPPLAEGQTFDNPAAEISERYTQPPKAFTEDTLLSAMESAGKEDTPEDAERKGLGTTATRAGIIEKLISAGFAERKGKKLIPTKDGYNLAAILPEVLTSPQLTAEWETRLTGIAKGSDSPDDFMRSIEEMTAGLVKTYSAISEDKAKLFTPQREAIGTCPRCGAAVYEGKKNYYCSDRACSFVMWKNDLFFQQRKKTFTKAIAAALLKDGKVKIKGMYSTKTGKTFDGVVLLADTGGKYVNFRVEQNRK